MSSEINIESLISIDSLLSIRSEALDQAESATTLHQAIITVIFKVTIMRYLQILPRVDRVGRIVEVKRSLF